MKKIIVGFEGLWSYNAGYIERGIFQPLEKQRPGEFAYQRYPWNASVPETSRNMVMIFAHSFGVRGAIELARQLRAMGVEVILILLDPRMPPCATSPTAPAGVKTISFYRTGIMSGRVCAGAENIRLPSSIGHTAVPFHPSVLKRVSEELK